MTCLLPGLLLAFVLAGMALLLRQLPYMSAASPLILAIAIGIGTRNIVGVPARCQPGIDFVLKRVLRAAIVLLGLQLTLGQVAAVGSTGLLIIVTTLIATFLFTGLVGRLLNVDAKLVQLIGAGTAICGASAVIVTNTVTEGSEEDVTYAVAIVTVFGSLSMFLFPAFSELFDLAPRAYGMWAGASIHEIAQVIAAAFQNGQESGEFAVIVKLSRVMMLAPMVLAIAWLSTLSRARMQRETPAHSLSDVRGAIPVPWFVLGFLCMILVNSLEIFPHREKYWVIQINILLFAAALAAMGLATDLVKMKVKGFRPLLVGAAAWAFIAILSLALVKMIEI